MVHAPAPEQPARKRQDAVRRTRLAHPRVVDDALERAVADIESAMDLVLVCDVADCRALGEVAVDVARPFTGHVYTRRFCRAHARDRG